VLFEILCASVSVSVKVKSFQRIVDQIIMEIDPSSSYTSPCSIKTNGYNSQAQSLIVNVMHFFREAWKNPSLLKGKPRYLASKALNIPERTLSRLAAKQKAGVEMRSPKRNKPIKKHKRDRFDSFDIQTIRNIIKSFYVSK